MSEQAVGEQAVKTRGTLVGDVIAGLTTGVANIPDAMASAILAGANPVQGLYAIMIGTPLGAIFGSSAFMNVAATSALAITAGMALSGYGGDAHATAMSTLALVTGVLMVLAGLFKLGRLLRFVANSVVIGFLTGVSINVILSQLGNFTGYSSENSNKVKAIDTALHLNQVDYATTAIGLLTVAIILIVGRTRLRNFSMLIGMVLGSAAVMLFGLAAVQQVKDVAIIPTSLPLPKLPDITLVPVLLVDALALTIIALVQGAAERPVVILRLRAQEAIGSSFVAVLERYAQQLHAHGGKLVLSGVNTKAKGQLDRTETTSEILGEDNVFVATPILGASTRAAVAAAERWLQEAQTTEAAQANPAVPGNGQANGQPPAAMEQIL